VESGANGLRLCTPTIFRRKKWLSEPLYWRHYRSESCSPPPHGRSRAPPVLCRLAPVHRAVPARRIHPGGRVGPGAVGIRQLRVPPAPPVLLALLVLLAPLALPVIRARPAIPAQVAARAAAELQGAAAPGVVPAAAAVGEFFISAGAPAPACSDLIPAGAIDAPVGK
jgi:hypothetical protein